MGTFHNIKSSYDRLVSLKAISKPVVMALSKEGISAHHLKLAVKRNKKCWSEINFEGKQVVSKTCTQNRRSLFR